MEDYKKEFVKDLASSGALFFKVNPGADKGEKERWLLTLKDGRPTPYFVNIGGFNTGSLGYKLGSYFGGALMGQKLDADDILLGPSHKGSALIAATAMYLALQYGTDLKVFYDHKEEGRIIGQQLHAGSGLVALGREISYENKKNLERASIIASPSYESNVLAVATAIMAQRMGINDLGFAYDRFEAKTHGEGSGKGTEWVGKTPKAGDKVFVIYNRAFSDEARLEQFNASVLSTGAELAGWSEINFNTPITLLPKHKIHLLDDVGTSMATKLDMIKLLEKESARLDVPLKLSTILLGIDREQVGPVYENPKDKSTVVLGARGEDAIGKFFSETGIPVNLVLGASEMVDVLHKERIPVKINDEMNPLDDAVKAEFHKYMDTYGARR